MRISICSLICILLIPVVDSPAQVARVADVALWDHAHSGDLAKAGVVPAQSIQISDATFHLSKPLALDESHQIAVAWVDVADENAIRVLYRSNSQCSWRMCDAITRSHIGKGFHEFDKQMPIDVTVALLRSCNDTGQLKPWFPVDNEPPSQKYLTKRILELLTVDRDAGLESGEVLSFGGRYVTREYASMIPSVPRRFSIVKERIRLPTGSLAADPSATELPPAELLPDFSKLVETVVFNIPSYGTFAQGDGVLNGRVYLSQNEKLKYFFVEDQEQRAMLACVEIRSAPICVLGLRTAYLDVEGMDIPLMEYGAQIPEVFGGRRKARYQLNWNWVRQVPIIEYYYRGTERDVPPSG